MLFKADPTFYPSPKLAGQAPAEKLAYVAALNAEGGSTPDALLVVDIDDKSKKYGEIVGQVDMPNAGDELHHFGWNACSSALCPYAISNCPRPSFLTHSRSRHQTKSEEAQDREGDRTANRGGAHRIHPSPYGALWTGRDLFECPGVTKR
jgi:hypothetical protein